MLDRLRIRHLAVALAALTLPCLAVAAGSAEAAVFKGAKNGYAVSMDTSEGMGSLRLPKRQVAGGRGPLWEVACGKKGKPRGLMFAVVPLSGQRTVSGPLGRRSPQRLRSCVVKRDGRVVAKFRTHAG